VKIGRRVFYRQQDLESWVADHLVGSTSEAEVGAI
jgi:hypothetical protein